MYVDWSWMTQALCRVGFNTLRDSFTQPSQGFWRNRTVCEFQIKTHRRRTWGLNQALDTIQRENQRDQF